MVHFFSHGGAKPFCEDVDGKDYQKKGKIITNADLKGFSACTKVGNNYECEDKCGLYNSHIDKSLLEPYCDENNKPYFIFSSGNEVYCDTVCAGCICEEGACVKS